MCGHRASFLSSAAPCGGLPSLTWQAHPGNAFLSPPSDRTSSRDAFIGHRPAHARCSPSHASGRARSALPSPRAGTRPLVRHCESGLVRSLISYGWQTARSAHHKVHQCRNMVQVGSIVTQINTHKVAFHFRARVGTKTAAIMIACLKPCRRSKYHRAQGERPHLTL